MRAEGWWIVQITVHPRSASRFKTLTTCKLDALSNPLHRAQRSNEVRAGAFKFELTSAVYAFVLPNKQLNCFGLRILSLIWID